MAGAEQPRRPGPSHGTRLFTTAYAIDFVPVDERGRSARLTLASILRPEPPEAFRGIPSIRYAFTQRQRVAGGWLGLAGNHVVIELRSGELVALCHLQHGSVRVSVGQSVAVGDEIGRCGNSGNSTEPHVHVQAMDALDLGRANAVPISFEGGLPPNRELVHVP